jgi:hypothetical protein
MQEVRLGDIACMRGGVAGAESRAEKREVDDDDAIVLYTLRWLEGYPPTSTYWYLLTYLLGGGKDGYCG